MAYLDHVRACTDWRREEYRPFHLGERRIGWVRHALARRLADWPTLFTVEGDAVVLADNLATADARTTAMQEVAERLAESGDGPRLRGERYAVVERPGGETLFTLDRGAVPAFGVLAFGQHVNGVVETADGPSLWIGRRASDRRVAPDKLDNLIGGGVPDGLGLEENLVKESAEEAGLSPDLARTARPVGAITYAMTVPEGLRRDVLYLYDLALEADFRPSNTDGEVVEFTLMSAAEAARIVRETADFKFNVNLVIIDFLARRGLLDPTEPDYVEILRGLRSDPGC
ncbi:MAG: DUF4743 domain-containing protein [Azospirillaceae bacterium]